MKIDIKTSFSQRVRLRRKILQALNILQQSQAELQQTVQQALESNIMLEEDSAPTEPQAADGEQTESVAQDLPEEAQTDDIDTAWENISPTDSPLPQGFSVDKADAINAYTAEESLHGHLREQVQYLDLDDVEYSMALAIIDAVNDKGYLGEPLRDLAAMFASNRKQMEKVLKKVQGLDPPGVAARTPQECLKLQLLQRRQEQQENTGNIDDALLLVEKAMQLLASGGADRIGTLFGWATDRVSQAIELIRDLNPHPGADYDSSPMQQMVPEVYVRRADNEWKIELSSNFIPKLRINPHYMNLVSSGNVGAADSSLKTHLQEARWLIENLRSRADVVLQVSRCIVNHQENFLRFGEEALRPMTLEDVAREVGVHISTVSRATISKYIHTPQGIFPFRYFFPSQVQTEYSDGTSSTAVKALIKKLVAAEDPARPMSDGAISVSLEQRGIKIARRTVAKYREQINIPARKDRRRITLNYNQ